MKKRHNVRNKFQKILLPRFTFFHLPLSLCHLSHGKAHKAIDVLNLKSFHFLFVGFFSSVIPYLFSSLGCVKHVVFFYSHFLVLFFSSVAPISLLGQFHWHFFPLPNDTHFDILLLFLLSLQHWRSKNFI